METRAAVKARLLAEGRWEQAKAFRDQRKGEGAAPAQAWKDMLMAFPPLTADAQAVALASVQTVGSEGGAAPLPPIEATSAKRQRRRKGKAAGRVDLCADVAFAYANMGEDPDTIIAPTAGARELLRLAKTDPAGFLKSFASKLMTKTGDGSKADRVGHDPWNDDDQTPEQRDRGQKLLEDFMRANGYTERTPEAESDTPLPPPVVVQPPQEFRPAAPRTPPPKRLKACEFCEKDRLEGRKPLENCARCAYIRYYGIEEETSPS